MRRRPQSGHQQPKSQAGAPDGKGARVRNLSGVNMRRSGSVWAVLVSVLAYSSYAVYRYQFENMPLPLSAAQAGRRAFSEERALKHIEFLTSIGPHPVGSYSLDLAFNYVLQAAQTIKDATDPDFDVEVENFHAKSGANRLQSGLFKGKTLVYSDLHHVILKISPKHSLHTEETSILISSHIDSVVSTAGAGDCSSCVATMLELARAVSLSAHRFKHSIIFLFNTGEEEGLNGAHSFITQHPLSSTIRMAIDLEAMGIGGKSSIFQANHPVPIESFARSAKHPSGNIISQDLFSAGIIKSATDFQIYRDIANLSGLDFAFTDRTAVYHTRNDKLELLKPGSLQHLGDNLLSFLIHTASSQELTTTQHEESPVYFDILGTYMVVYRRRFASTLYNSVIFQSVLILATSLIMGGSSGALAFLLSIVSLVLMWVFSLGFSALVAVLLPLICSSPVPYVAYPWISIGLFAFPSLIGAFCGQHIGYLILIKYLSKDSTKGDIVKLEAERWLFKSGFLPWLILLVIGNYYDFGSAYLALTWLVPPAFAYGMIEATLTPSRRPKPMKLATLMFGLFVPIIISAGTFVRLAGTLIGMIVRFDRNPGSTPESVGNMMIAAFISAILCLTMVYVVSYLHLSASKTVLYLFLALFCGSIFLVKCSLFPPFTDDTARTVGIVHVVDANGKEPSSFVSLFSYTPGSLDAEAGAIEEGFTCKRNVSLDFVAFSVKYGCIANDDVEDRRVFSEMHPEMNVVGDEKSNGRRTLVSIDTKSSVRWVLAINAKKVGSFSLKGRSEEFVEDGDVSDVDGWHLVQFSGGRNSPTVFELTLFWVAGEGGGEDGNLLKLRTDVNALTPKVERVMRKLPAWCSVFGKSTSPYSLVFLKNLRLEALN